jgi:hypothetical protein
MTMASLHCDRHAAIARHGMDGFFIGRLQKSVGPP